MRHLGSHSLPATAQHPNSKGLSKLLHSLQSLPPSKRHYSPSQNPRGNTLAVLLLLGMHPSFMCSLSTSGRSFKFSHFL